MSEVITDKRGNQTRIEKEWTGANYSKTRKIVIDVEKYINQKFLACPKCNARFADVASLNDHRPFCGRL